LLRFLQEFIKICGKKERSPTQTAHRKWDNFKKIGGMGMEKGKTLGFNGIYTYR
jgi:predicted flap endonuclease-1-like 5' DNA nuclease